MLFEGLLSSRGALPLSKSERDFLGGYKGCLYPSYRAREIMFKIDFISFDAYFSVNHGSRVHPGRKDRHFKTTSSTQTVEGLSYTLWKLFNLLLFYRLTVEEILASYL